VLTTTVKLGTSCQASGYSRDDYRAILDPCATTPEARKGRWQKWLATVAPPGLDEALGAGRR
jgi:hypothetical protein